MIHKLDQLRRKARSMWFRRAKLILAVVLWVSLCVALTAMG